jgi:hypothetical protein
MSGYHTYVWITLLTKDAAEPLMGRLAAKGCTVSPLDKSGKSLWEGEASALLALDLHLPQSTAKKVDSPAEALTWVKDILAQLGISYHSVVLSVYGITCTWNGGNIKLPKKTRFDKLKGESNQDQQEKDP